MDEITSGLRRLWETFFAWLPKLVGALIVLLIGYLVAKGVGELVTRLLKRTNLDEYIKRGKGGSYLERLFPSISGFIGSVAFWVIFLWAIAISINVLGIPVVIDFLLSIYNYIPNIIAAFLIFIVAGLLTAGVETLVRRTMADTPTAKLLMAVAPVIIIGIAIFMILDQLQIAGTIVTITYATLMGGIFLGLALAFGLGGREVAAKLLDSAYRTGQRQSEQVKRDIEVGKRNAAREAEKLRRKTER